MLASFVEYFNINRVDFDEVIEEMRVSAITYGLDLTDEFYELPNADIIFTFNHDIIRYFYRRQ